MTVFIFGTLAYFYFFKREFLKSYIRDKQLEIEDKIAKDAKK